jgi:hypothetical protein
MSHGLLLFAAGVLTFFWFLFMLADYGWERKKCRGLDAQAQPRTFGAQSEQVEYEWYSWIRFFVTMLLTYLNAVGAIDSEPKYNDGLVSPVRMFWSFCAVILFSIGLLAIDGYWDRKRRRGLSGRQKSIFWSYFWLRYPALILATITATKQGLHP